MPDAAETPLEQTFSDLANARLRDRSPALLDYLVGFQLVRSNDDGSKAVGIFGFEIGDSWHYAPVFFMNGEIKGLDSIYSVSSDLFVPLSEDWVNQIINRRPNQLGEVDTRSREERGVHAPNFHRLRNLPGGITGFSVGKVASDESFVQQFAGAIDQMSIKRAYADLPSLAEMVGCMGEVVARGFIGDLRKMPKLAAAVAEYYPLISFTDETMKVAAAARKAQDDAVKIVASIRDPGAADLTDEQKRELLTGQEVVLDQRSPALRSIVYRTEINEQLQNPSKGGLYDVLKSDGTVETVLALRCLGADAYLLVDADKRHGIVPQSRIWTVRQHDDASFRKRLGELTKKPSSLKKNDCVVLVADNGESTLGLEIGDVSGGELKTIAIRGGYWLPSETSWAHCSPVWQLGADQRVSSIVVSPAGSASLRYTADKLLVNDQRCHAIVLNTVKDEPESYGAHTRKLDEVRIRAGELGDHTTVRAVLEKSAAPVKIWRTDDDLTVRDQYGTQVLSKVAALGYLMRRHGCDVEDARAMLKEASREPKLFRVKYAAQLLPFPNVDDTQTGGVMDQFHLNQTPQAGIETADPKDNRETYMYHSPFDGGQSTGQAVQRAAETGQKEVFDATVLQSLVKTHNPTDMVDRFLPTIVAGMDRLGRLLFLIHWHFEEFGERYSKDELADFLDDLKSSFEAMGDLVLFMRKRSLSGDPEYYGLGLQATMDG